MPEKTGNGSRSISFCCFIDQIQRYYQAGTWQGRGRIVPVKSKSRADSGSGCQPCVDSVGDSACSLLANSIEAHSRSAEQQSDSDLIEYCLFEFLLD